MNTLRRTLHPEVRILDATKGISQYVASDETLDSYKEVIRASGWRFDNFERNAAFVDSHDYSSIAKRLGSVLDFKVEKKKLVETVQWAIDVAENTLAQFGFKMLAAGHLPAVSVGFWPVKTVSKFDQDKTQYDKELARLGLDESDETQRPRTIYLEQQQVELSAVIIGANPNALARAYKAGILDDATLDMISEKQAERNSRVAVTQDSQAAAHRASQRRKFLEQIHTITKRL
jgi:hypothetical protein